jgi:hypothetical protein
MAGIIGFKKKAGPFFVEPAVYKFECNIIAGDPPMD